MRTALIDGDTFVYAAASSSETGVQWDEGTYTLTGDLDQGIARLDADLDAAVEAVEADEVVIALSASGHRWRNDVIPSYKETRGRKPLIYNALRDYVNETRTVYERPTLEGDDVLGILATSKKIIKGEKVIVAIDKDLRTVPGLLFNPNRPKEGIQEISEADADLFFYTQVLTGDPTDGYKGCPGVGPKKAEKILSDPVSHRDTWQRIVAAYEKAGLTEDDALAQARVARILRVTDYDFKKKEVILWRP